jgi:hypothetical protein
MLGQAASELIVIPLEDGPLDDFVVVLLLSGPVAKHSHWLLTCSKQRARTHVVCDDGSSVFMGFLLVLGRLVGLMMARKRAGTPTVGDCDGIS